MKRKIAGLQFSIADCQRAGLQTCNLLYCSRGSPQSVRIGEARGYPSQRDFDAIALDRMIQVTQMYRDCEISAPGLSFANISFSLTEK